jgi:serine protease SohB
LEFLYEYGLFLAKTVTFVIAIVVVIALITASAMKQKMKKGQLEVIDLSEQIKETAEEIEHSLLTKEALKQKQKAQKKAAKAKKKQAEQPTEQSKLFVVDFKGSIDAKEVNSLREEISAILMIAEKHDEVLVRLESGGGMVHGYGLAASQLDRVRQRGIPLTVAVDKVAASGGYMMACVADKIIAAPFAILGSIGVIAQIPNFHKVLKKNDIEFEQLTAGEYKRTLTMFGENTEKGRQKFIEELEETHQLFKSFVTEHRPTLDIQKVATGEHWFGIKAKELGLVDEILTSDDYVYQAAADRKVVQLKFERKKGLADKLTKAASLSVSELVNKLWQHNRLLP